MSEGFDFGGGALTPIERLEIIRSIGFVRKETRSTPCCCPCADRSSFSSEPTTATPGRPPHDRPAPTSADQKAALSVVYAKAVAARAGYVTSVPDLDRDGVDLRIEAGGAMRPALDLQLKATARLGVPAFGSLTFALKRRNYDLLRVDTQTPRILVVLVLPDNPEPLDDDHPGGTCFAALGLLAQPERSG